MNKDLIYRLEALLDRYPEISGGFEQDIRLVIRRLAQLDKMLKLLLAAIERATGQPKDSANEETRMRQEALQSVLDYFCGDEQSLRLMGEKRESRA